jgi:Xaa-Pro aminopeptidase
MAGRVAAAPPAELVAAQRATLEVVRALGGDVRPGVTERELATRAEELAREQGASGVWTPIAVGAGPGNLVCHPDFPPTDRAVADPDLVWLDVTPEFDGWAGDVTRSILVGADEARAQAVADCERIKRSIVEAIRPGMQAKELFAVARSLLDAGGYELLDLLGNVGHDLGPHARVTGYIDPRNETPMWGCWAIEPHIGMNGIGAKVEDLVWIGAEGVVVLG